MSLPFFTFLFQEVYTLSGILICLVLSALFASAETAITCMGTLKTKHLVGTRKRGHAFLKLWLTYPSRVLTTILIFNNGVNIFASALATKLALQYTQDQSIGVATASITLLVLIFGEIIPKSFAKVFAERIAIFSMGLVLTFYYVGFPVVWVLSELADYIIRFVSKGTKVAPLITEAEIEFMVNEGEKAGVIQDLKRDIIEGAFEFDETKVKEIMTPRPDLIAIPDDMPVNEILDIVVQSGHSRIPIYKKQKDHIIGLLLAKDLLVLSQKKEGENRATARDFLRTCLFLPESKSIMEAFKELKRTKSHLAVIIDEYGGTAGIVTMEDILEEFVGEIQDEFDKEEEEIIPIGEGVFEVSGTIHIEEFLDFFDLTEESLGERYEEDIDTLSGWITQLIGQLPKKGQTVRIGPLYLEVLSTSNRRIEKVRVQLKEPEITL
jgi:putative hemolysin